MMTNLLFHQKITHGPLEYHIHCNVFRLANAWILANLILSKGVFQLFSLQIHNPPMWPGVNDT